MMRYWQRLVVYNLSEEYPCIVCVDNSLNNPHHLYLSMRKIGEKQSKKGILLAQL